MRDAAEVKPLAIHGKGSIALLGVIVAAVALVPSVDLHAIHEGHAPVAAWIPFREIVLLTAAFLSFRLGDRKTRFEDNRFEWGPIQEVAALFIGIFLTMVPALAVPRPEGARAAAEPRHVLRLLRRASRRSSTTPRPT